MFLRNLLSAMEKYKARNAFCIHDVYYTYGDLLSLTASICGQIERERPSTGEDKIIAVLCTDDIRTYASLLAIWFSGCAYVPLGLHNPTERNLTILGDAGCKVLLSTAELTDPRYSAFTVITPGSTPASADPASASAHPASTSRDIVLAASKEHDPAYILFTSGSTGTPKGVPISYANLASFVRAFSRSPYTLGEDDRCLQMFELTFDVSISSFLLPLLHGACIYTIPDGAIKYMGVLKLLHQHKLTSIQIVPSVIKLAQPLLPKLNFPSVRQCILTGEATPVDLLPLWEPCVPNAAILNFYGPTEATIYTSFYPYDRKELKSYNGLMAIGKAFSGMDLLVVNDNGAEAGPGEKGELLIGGPQLTRGYLNNPDLNRTAFLERRTGDSIKRFYRSGDLCFLDETGDIFYCGRLDNQVKIRGYRVELGEIEYQVRKFFDINSVVIVSKDKTGMVVLGLILETQDVSKLQAVLGHLKNKLPDYMIPGYIRTIKEFPLNTSGKTDRKKIKELIVEPA